MEKVRIGIFGARRGSQLIRTISAIENAKLVAICGRRNTLSSATSVAKMCGIDSVTTYTDFDEFLEHDMDAVILTNYAHEHTPYAIKALSCGKHVLSETFACSSMKEAVELIEAVENSGKVYNLMERYCYNPSILSIKEAYENGEVGTLMSMEGSYVHNIAAEWPQATRGNRYHWRNQMASTSYTTHAVGPGLFITGLRPVKVVGFETPQSQRMKNVGYAGGAGGHLVLTLEDGTIYKASCEFYGGMHTGFTLHGELGTLELSKTNNNVVVKDTIREDNPKFTERTTNKVTTDNDRIEKSSLSRSDFIAISNFVNSILGEKAITVDVYQAVEISLAGLLGFKSIINNNSVVEFPNLRDKDVRDAYRNDTFSVFQSVGGDQYVANNAAQEDTSLIDESVYEYVKSIL